MLKLTILAYVFFLVFCVGVGIQLNGNRYEEIYIVVQDKVDENTELLTRIQEVFTEASSLLFQATKNHVYFGKIKILIPKSWSSQSEYIQKPSFSTFDGYITIDDGLIKIPHVRRKSYMCGEEGAYMYLTPAFLLETERTEWGKHDHVIVHEWGHLRWGLQDEYADQYKKSSQFYQDGGQWKPIRCSEKLEGVVGIGSDCKTTLAETYCNTLTTSRRMHDSCAFCPNLEQTVNSSIMGYQYIDAMTMFCDADDKSVPEAQRHNKVAPNAQNLFCDYKSAWEVMREHPDFLSGISPLPGSTNTTPEFEIIQEGVGYRVFVLDVSGSMAGARIASQYQTCQYIIQEIIPTGSWLGVVSFSDSATLLKDMMKVNTQADRDALKTVIPSSVGGYTCIGCGIDKAIERLQSVLGSAENGEIILLTDGEDNRGDLDGSRQNAINSKVVIHTIAVEQNADYRLPLIASETGGKHYTYLETGTVSFAAAFSETVSTGLTSAASEAVTLVTEKLDTISSSSLSFQFPIEDGLGLNTSVTVLTGTTNTMTLSLTGPNNYTDTAATSDSMLTLQIPGVAQAGEYSATVLVATNQRVEYYVRSSPVGSDVIRITTRVSKSSFNFTSGTEELPVIFADLKKSYAPVLNATVFGRAETGTITCDIELKDDGQDPDSVPDDGSYAGFLPPRCLDNGRINIKVNASGNNGETMIFKGLAGSTSPTTDDNITEAVNGSFQRVTTAEVLTISNYVNSSADTIAPGRITDLDIHDVKTELTEYGESRNFTLKWTAPGDDKNIGQAVAYEFRISENQTLLMTDFDNAENLTMLNGSIVPQTSGSQEALELVVDAEQSYTDTAFLAIRAVDEAGNAGKVSNIISVTVARGFRASAQRGVIHDIVYDFDLKVDHDNFEDKNGWNTQGLIIGLSLVGGVVLIATAVVMFIMKSKKHKRLVEDSVCSSRTSISTKSTFLTDTVLNKRFNTSTTVMVERLKPKSASSVTPSWNTSHGSPGEIYTHHMQNMSNRLSQAELLSDEQQDCAVVDIEDDSVENNKTDDNERNMGDKVQETNVTTNVEEALNDFEDDNTYLSPNVNLPRLAAPPFFMTNKAQHVKGYDGAFEADDESMNRAKSKITSSVANPGTTELLQGLPELPFTTRKDTVEHDHPPPNMAPHILKPEEYGAGKRAYAFPAPFSGVRGLVGTLQIKENDVEDQ